MQRNTEGKKASIIASAVDFVIKNGARDFTMIAFASSINSSKALMYYYFPGPCELLTEVYRTLLQRETEWLRSKSRESNLHLIRDLEIHITRDKCVELPEFNVFAAEVSKLSDAEYREYVRI